ncbi:hypothetical protein BN2475_550034 [Paraburkholderia ribeironis]|uniref:Uncharacterized protein n=1 Tax=Paraburkholderia ribeironis TaxID=1247936 RepID=A0A1N7SDI5_9BURK|nr:hypothetical protein BN2475_550034 [Paraburkholderia ribeironis]
MLTISVDNASLGATFDRQAQSSLRGTLCGASRVTPTRACGAPAQLTKEWTHESHQDWFAGHHRESPGRRPGGPRSARGGATACAYSRELAELP